jgi:hypothetical protein
LAPKLQKGGTCCFPLFEFEIGWFPAIVAGLQDG